MNAIIEVPPVIADKLFSLGLDNTDVELVFRDYVTEKSGLTLSDEKQEDQFDTFVDERRAQLEREFPALANYGAFEPVR